MKVVVIGAGAGALSAMVDLLARGFDATLCSTYSGDTAALRAIQMGGGVEYSGIFGEGLVDAKTSKDLTIVKEADVVMVVTLAQGHAFYAEQLAGVLRPDQLVMLNPGYPGGILRFAKILRERGGTGPFHLSELNNLAYACRTSSPSMVRILRKANYLLFGTLPADDADSMTDRAREIYSFIEPAQNVLETAMMNPNIIAHPAGIVLNAGWVESTKGDFYFYRQGNSPSVARVMEQQDLERLKICEAIGIKTMPISEYYVKVGYSTVGGRGVYETFQNSEVNKNLKAPSSLDDRFMSEDIGYGLVPVAAFARTVNVETPTTNALVHLASALTGIDFKTEGLNAEKMGIAGMTGTQLLRYATYGKPETKPPRGAAR